MGFSKLLNKLKEEFKKFLLNIKIKNMNPRILESFLLKFIKHNVQIRVISIIDIFETGVSSFLITYYWLDSKDGQIVEKIDNIKIDNDFNIIKL